MEGSPFNRSALTRRSPPPTPSPAPEPRRRPQLEDNAPDLVSTAEIQNWMTLIEQNLNEVCTISSEGKLNSEQKLRIHNLCRKVGHGTSQMAVQYQSLKQKTIQTHLNMQQLKETRALTQQLDDLKLTIKETAKSDTRPTSFADMVKKSTDSYIQPMTLKSVAIYPTDKLKSSEETKTLIQNIIRPDELKLHVRGLHKTKNGGVILSTDSKIDIEKVKQSVQQKTTCLTVDDALKRKPRIVVIGVPSSMQEKEVFSCLYSQNLSEKLQSLTLETFLSSTKLSHKSGKKNSESCNYVIEVTPQIRKALITQDRLFVNWSSCPVRDFTLVTRCFKCQQYGHAAKTCRAEANTCGHCGELGHAVTDCAKKAETPKCATCMHYKKPCDHNTGDINCPAKIMAEKRYINSVDYGSA